jgi:hypothetical protein
LVKAQVKGSDTLSQERQQRTTRQPETQHRFFNPSIALRKQLLYQDQGKGDMITYTLQPILEIPL